MARDRGSESAEVHDSKYHEALVLVADDVPHETIPAVELSCLSD